MFVPCYFEEKDFDLYLFLSSFLSFFSSFYYRFCISTASSNSFLSRNSSETSFEHRQIPLCFVFSKYLANPNLAELYIDLYFIDICMYIHRISWKNLLDWTKFPLIDWVIPFLLLYMNNTSLRHEKSLQRFSQSPVGIRALRGFRLIVELSSDRAEHSRRIEACL